MCEHERKFPCLCRLCVDWRAYLVSTPTVRLESHLTLLHGSQLWRDKPDVFILSVAEQIAAEIARREKLGIPF